MKRQPLPHIPGFKLLRKLGEGASGSVFHAIQQGQDRDVALKLFEPVDHPQATLPDDVARERRIASSLRHPHLARIHANGAYGERQWLACEYLSGGTLAERIARRMPLPDVLDALHDIAAGLGHAHAKGIVHGDVKPGNVLFRSRHRHKKDDAVLVDYGVAAFAHGAAATAQGGTPDYMSPEQARGGPIDGRSDFYSLGITLHEMLTGRLPPRDEPIPTLPERVRWLQPLLDTLLAEKPADRPADAQALLDMLASLRLASPEAIALNPRIQPLTPRIHGSRTQRNLPIRAAAVLAALLLAVLLWWVWR